MAPIGKLLILTGLILVVIGILIWLSPKIPLLGRLPGDIRYEGKHVRIYFPVVTCVVLSVVISLVFFLLSRK